MSASVYLKDKKIYMYLPNGNQVLAGGIGYDLGQYLLAFIRFDVESLGGFFEKAIQEAFRVEKSITNDEYLSWLADAMMSLNDVYPYLSFYTDLFVDYMLKMFSNQQNDFEQLLILLPELKEVHLGFTPISEGNNLSEEEMFLSVYYPDFPSDLTPEQKRGLYEMILSILFFAEGIKYNIINRQAQLAEEINFIYENSESEELKELSLGQKLYLFDVMRGQQEGKPPYYTEKEIPTKFTSFPYPVDDNTTLQDIKSLSQHIKDNNIEIVEMYEIAWVDDLIRFELLKLIEHDIIIKKCMNCGHFFIPPKRVDAIYCNVVDATTGKTCLEVGATNKYREKTLSNPILKAFEKAYKRYHRRTTTRKMTNQEFLDWSDKARQMRYRCVDGELSLEEFEVWLGNK